MNIKELLEKMELLHQRIAVLEGLAELASQEEFPWTGGEDVLAPTKEEVRGELSSLADAARKELENINKMEISDGKTSAKPKAKRREPGAAKAKPAKSKKPAK